MAYKLDPRDVIEGRKFSVTLSGWREVAWMTKGSKTSVKIAIRDEVVAALEGCVYAWRTPDGQDMRFGTAESKLRQRMQAYGKHITDSLEGRPSPSPEWEAKCWLAQLDRHGRLEAFAHQPDLIETIVGPVRPFLSIEKRMLQLCKPPLNRSRK